MDKDSERAFNNFLDHRYDRDDGLYKVNSTGKKLSDKIPGTLLKTVFGDAVLMKKHNFDYSFLNVGDTLEERVYLYSSNSDKKYIIDSIDDNSITLILSK